MYYIVAASTVIHYSATHMPLHRRRLRRLMCSLSVPRFTSVPPIERLHWPAVDWHRHRRSVQPHRTSGRRDAQLCPLHATIQVTARVFLQQHYFVRCIYVTVYQMAALVGSRLYLFTMVFHPSFYILLYITRR